MKINLSVWSSCWTRLKESALILLFNAVPPTQPELQACSRGWGPQQGFVLVLGCPSGDLAPICSSAELQRAAAPRAQRDAPGGPAPQLWQWAALCPIEFFSNYFLGRPLQARTKKSRGGYRAELFPSTVIKKTTFSFKNGNHVLMGNAVKWKVQCSASVLETGTAQARDERKMCLNGLGCSTGCMRTQVETSDSHFSCSFCRWSGR